MARSFVDAIPETAIQALMQTGPHEDPVTSKEDVAHLRDTIEDVIQSLDERERWIFNAIAVERRPIRAVAADLSLAKSYVHRIYQTARTRLAYRLLEYPEIREFLNR